MLDTMNKSDSCEIEQHGTDDRKIAMIVHDLQNVAEALTVNYNFFPASTRQQQARSWIFEGRRQAETSLVL